MLYRTTFRQEVNFNFKCKCNFDQYNKQLNYIMEKSHISTHVLDTSLGIPVPNLPVSLYKNESTIWSLISESKTTSNGRCSDLLEIAGQLLTGGRYKLVFNVENYFTTTKRSSLYPIIEVIFDIKNDNQNYHLPLLVNPFGYSTYRGT